jgi:hypothetical protein
MPRTPVDYSKTIIYKLVKNDDYDNANIYIGSTTDFTRRKNSHKSNCYNEKQQNYNNKKYQYIRENGGWDCFDMIEVEKYPCNDKREAEAREEYWRSQFNAKLNAIRAYTTDEQKKEEMKEYKEQNKVKIKEQVKEYREEHKEIIALYYKKKYEANKEKMKEYNKEKYERNKDKLSQQKSQKITCICGCITTKGHLAQHKKTQNHIKKLDNLIITNDIAF